MASSSKRAFSSTSAVTFLPASAASISAATIGRVLRGAVERLLDGDDFRIARGLAQELGDDVEGFIRVVDEDVLHADRREDVAIVLAHAFGEARLERREDEVGAAVDDQLFQLVHAHDAVDFDDIHRLGADLLDEEGLEIFGRATVDLEAHDAAAAALLQQDFEFADKVFGLFLDLDVAVADDAQDAAAASTRSPGTARRGTA